jgi:hypothetical protein
MSTESARDFSNEFSPLEIMPTDRLQDMMNDLNTKQMTVLNLDALIPNNTDTRVLRTILDNITESVRTLSLRFNNFKSNELCDILIEWIGKCYTIEALYLMGTNMDEKNRVKIGDAWGKNLIAHRTETYGFSFFRINPLSVYIPPEMV